MRPEGCPRRPGESTAIGRGRTAVRRAAPDAYFLTSGQVLFDSGMKAWSAGIVATSLK